MSPLPLPAKFDFGESDVNEGATAMMRLQTTLALVRESRFEPKINCRFGHGLAIAVVFVVVGVAATAAVVVGGGRGWLWR